MGKLRHLAFISREPKKLSDFYQKFFGLEEVRVFPSGSRMVIDGLFNLAFLQQNAGQAAVAIENARLYESATRWLRQLESLTEVLERAGGRPVALLHPRPAQPAAGASGEQRGDRAPAHRSPDPA